jgi:hypothetical protein
MIKIKGLPDLDKLFKEQLKVQKPAILKKLVEDLKDATPVDTGEAREGWHLDTQGNIVNDVEHIEYLNAGSSKQAPAHFIEKTLLTQKGINPSGTIVRST